MLKFHPEPGTIIVCDFKGLKQPEMIKRRPVIVVSPRLRSRGNLCTVVPLSTSHPNLIQPYHYNLKTVPPLPAPYSSPMHWVKCDMLYTVGFHRLSLLFDGKDSDGKRIYDVREIDADDLSNIRDCIRAGLGLT
jgi:uncharacterized protein YifN (PemK superfamily)